MLVAISGHGVEFWEVETQNFNFLKKMKTDSKAKFHPTTFTCDCPYYKDKPRFWMKSSTFW